MPLIRSRNIGSRSRVLWIVSTLGIALASSLGGCSADDSAATIVTVDGADPTPDAAATRDREVAEVYAAAKAKDVSRLLGFVAQLPAPTPVPTPMRADPAPASAASPSTVASSAPTPTSAVPDVSPTASPTPVARYDPAIALGLYYADPKDYVDSFVASYPRDPDGVSHDYGSRWVTARVASAGALYPINALATLAAGGNDAAFARLYEALPASRGGIYRAYAHAIGSVSASKPDRALALLVLARPAARLDVLAHGDWCGGDAKNVLSQATTDDFQTAIKNDLAQTVKTTCANVRAKPERRKPRAIRARKPAKKSA